MNYIAERRQEEKERRRAEILDAAEQVTATAGWDEVTMDQVARRARLSRALLYVYFKDKTDLMYGICERALGVLYKRFQEAAAAHQLGLDQVVAVGGAYIALSQEFPVYFDIIARCALREVNTTDAPANEAACQLVGEEMLALIVRVFDTGVRDGSIRADLGNRMVAATALWGFTHGVIQVVSTKAKVWTMSGVAPREMLDQAMRMVTRSLAAKI